MATSSSIATYPSRSLRNRPTIEDPPTGQIYAVNAGDLAVFGLRALAGGLFVVAFALTGEVLSPKAFSGLFSSSPAVALGSLTLVTIIEGTGTARQASIGMTVGAIAMTASCIVAATAIPRLGALWGSAAAWLGWLMVGLGLYWAVFVGAR
jgi:hypothetical protein